jgi:hypothetical protein
MIDTEQAVQNLLEPSLIYLIVEFLNRLSEFRELSLARSLQDPFLHIASRQSTVFSCLAILLLPVGSSIAPITQTPLRTFFRYGMQSVGHRPRVR